MKKILILGSGKVGTAVALELANSFHVTIVDNHEINLSHIQNSNKFISTKVLDVLDIELLLDTASQYDIIVGCLPGFLGFQTILQLLKLEKPIVDISFFPEDIYDLEEPARIINAPIIVDCGVAPGLCNIILGYHVYQMNVESYKCYVGGLPKIRQWPWEYKAVFSLIDVIEEYIRTARFRLNGQLVKKEALSDPELIDFEHIGTLEAWNSDGLRSLLKSFPEIPNMIEKTLRYPGTTKYIKALRDTGFFSYEPMQINNTTIRPIDFTSKLLSEKWQMSEQDEDITIMIVEIKGIENNIPVTYIYELFDTKLNGVISMARTTGYTCCAVVNAIAIGMIDHKGLCPPEYLGKDKLTFNFILDYLKDRQIKIITKKQILQ